jgi:hypothetical protein
MAKNSFFAAKEGMAMIIVSARKMNVKATNLLFFIPDLLTKLIDNGLMGIGMDHKIRFFGKDIRFFSRGN